MMRATAVAANDPQAGARARIKPRLLIVEDDEDIRLALEDMLTALGYETSSSCSAVDATQTLEQTEVDVVLTDVRMSGMNGIELCHYLTGDRPGIPVVVMTAFGDAHAAMDALRAGAFDFITKPLTRSRVAEVVERAIDHGHAIPGIARLTEPDLPDSQATSLIGSSHAMQTLKHQIAYIALTDAFVLIEGESGTGKELVARALHAASPRRHSAFRTANCCSLSDDLLESELFGRNCDAPDGAESPQRGLFVEVADGILLLDEIADVPLRLQPRLLRALQDGVVRPNGSSHDVPHRARIVATTNRDLSAAGNSGEFRCELSNHIDMITVRVPPLRERNRDAVEIAYHFLQTRFPARANWEVLPSAEALMLNYTWPGNVRELENCIHAAVTVARDHRIGPDELPLTIRQATTAHSTNGGASLAQVERHHIEAVLDACDWNKVRAARALGVDRATLYRKMARLGLTARQAGG